MRVTILSLICLSLSVAAAPVALGANVAPMHHHVKRGGEAVIGDSMKIGRSILGMLRGTTSVNTENSNNREALHALLAGLVGTSERITSMTQFRNLLEAHVATADPNELRARVNRITEEAISHSVIHITASRMDMNKRHQGGAIITKQLEEEASRRHRFSTKTTQKMWNPVLDLTSEAGRILEITVVTPTLIKEIKAQKEKFRIHLNDVLKMWYAAKEPELVTDEVTQYMEDWQSLLELTAGRIISDDMLQMKDYTEMVQVYQKSQTFLTNIQKEMMQAERLMNRFAVQTEWVSKKMDGEDDKNNL